MTNSAIYPPPEYCSSNAVKGIFQEQRKIDLLRSAGETTLVAKHEEIKATLIINFFNNFPLKAIQKGPVGGL